MVTQLVCILALLITVASSNAVAIRGGVATTSASHPYYVSIQDSDGTHVCGGALISKDVVATAASCLADYVVSELVVHVGSGNSIPIAISKFDSAYDFVTNENDVGLLKLAQPIVLSSTVGIISVASSQPTTGASGVVVGYDTNNKLVEIPVSVISSADCASGKYKYNEDEVFNSEVCALATTNDACDAEPGSPLVSNNQLIGLVSWGYGCANKGNPTVYTNIATLNSWISTSSKSL
ncbi:trypsin-like [Eurosta solidaginis]|uniref:trypsin-like n=1 Tax=Eurosta solidaginis TaxID=178769 RepID=UPI0035311AFB